MGVKSRAAAACAAVLSTVAAVGSPAAAYGDEDPVGGMLRAALASFPAFASVPDSRALELPVMLHGRLTSADGVPLTGAQVLLSAWPSNDVLHALPIGATFATTPVARTVAGREGRYELRSLLTPLLASLTTRDGLDIELDVFHGGRHYTYLNQVVPDQSTGGWLHRVSTDAPAPAAALGANARNALDVSLHQEAAREVGRSYLQASLPSDQRPPAPPGCGPFEKWALSTAMTTVATAVARNGVKVTTEYTREASSELTIGASKDGSLSPMPGGYRKRTSGHGAIWEERVKRKATVSREYRVDWQHMITRRLCAKDFRGSYYEPTYMTSPDQTTGGIEPANKNSQRYRPWKCDETNTRTAGSKWAFTDNATAYTYGADWSLPVTPEASLTGSARSGYSEQVKITFEFPNPSKAYWCGSSGFPATKGQRVQAVQGEKNETIPGQR